MLVNRSDFTYVDDMRFSNFLDSERSENGVLISELSFVFFFMSMNAFSGRILSLNVTISPRTDQTFYLIGTLKTQYFFTIKSFPDNRENRPTIE